MPSELIEEIQKEIRKFVWKNKKARINFHIMKQPKECGCLRLVDLSAKHTSLILQWVFHCLENPILSATLDEACVFLIGQEIWRCNLRHTDLRHVIDPNSWWAKVAKKWCEFNFFTPLTYHQVLKQNIWLNSHIRIDNRPVFHALAWKEGTRTIKDLVDENDRIYPHEELCKKWPSVGWLLWYSVLQAISPLWKNILVNRVRQEENYDLPYDVVRVKPKKSTFLYKQLTMNRCAFFDSYNNWNKLFETELSVVRFEKAYVNISKITISTKLRDFQFRLLHKHIPSNRELHRWKIKTSSKCELCNMEDNILHMLYTCGIVQDMWGKLFDYIAQLAGNSIFDKSVEAVILNDVHPKAGNIANLMCLVLKQLIFQAR